MTCCARMQRPVIILSDAADTFAWAINALRELWRYLRWPSSTPWTSYEILEARLGRVIPNLAMRASNVVGLMSRIWAAPPGPRIRQPVS